MRAVMPSRITQHFAAPGSYASRSDRHGPAGHHTGIDYGSAWPIPIYRRKVRAVLPGRVVVSGYNSTMGHWVTIFNHKHNLLVSYWHLDSRRVRPGDWVQVFAVVGRVGTTGNSTAPHLHLQVNRGATFDYHGHVNPHEALRLYSRKEARRIFRRTGGKHPLARFH